MRAAKRAEREEKQAKKVINWIIGALIVLFLISTVVYLIVG